MWGNKTEEAFDYVEAKAEAEAAPIRWLSRSRNGKVVRVWREEPQAHDKGPKNSVIVEIGPEASESVFGVTPAPGEVKAYRMTEV